MKTKIAVLGSTGMLGSMVASCLRKNSKFEVLATTRKEFDAESFVDHHDAQLPFKTDYIINCIGIIKPYCKDDDAAGVRRAIKVNGLFPHKLAAQATKVGMRTIQIATDCVYSGSKGKYVETDAHDALDVYGKSKSLGEVFNKELLNIRCSIIGPEHKGKTSLLEWFLAQPNGSELKGFAHHHWNGVTTLQFAQLCEKIILEDSYQKLLEIRHTLHWVPNQTVDKFELLNLMAQTFGRTHKVLRVDNIGLKVDRSVDTKFAGFLGNGQKPMKDVLTELRDYMSKTKEWGA